MLLSAETASFSKSSLTAGRRAQNRRASLAGNGRLGVREDCADGVATWTLYIHEITVGVLHQPLQLVCPSLLLGRRVEKVNGQRHLEVKHP